MGANDELGPLAGLAAAECADGPESTVQAGLLMESVLPAPWHACSDQRARFADAWPDLIHLALRSWRLLQRTLKEAIMQSVPTTNQYSKVIANSKRVRWDIDNDVIRHRRFDLEKTFLP